MKITENELAEIARAEAILSGHFDKNALYQNRCPKCGHQVEFFIRQGTIHDTSYYVACTGTFDIANLAKCTKCSNNIFLFRERPIWFWSPT